MPSHAERVDHRMSFFQGRTVLAGSIARAFGEHTVLVEGKAPQVPTSRQPAGTLRSTIVDMTHESWEEELP